MSDPTTLPLDVFRQRPLTRIDAPRILPPRCHRSAEARFHLDHVRATREWIDESREKAAVRFFPSGAAATRRRHSTDANAAAAAVRFGARRKAKRASARIMSFRRIIMRERSRRARQSVSFTYRGRFNYPIASSSPLLASRHRTAPLFYSARSRAIATQRGAARRPVFE